MEMMIIDQRTVLDKEFRIYGTREDPMFLAKDVAEWIDYSKTGGGFYNVNQMLKGLDDDEKLLLTMLVPGQQKRDMWFVTENGLYEILMQSRKPIAKQFKAEVKKILKEIRLNKGYVIAGQEAEFVEKAFSYLPDDLLRQVSAHIHAHNQVLEAKVGALNTTVSMLKGDVLAWADRDFIVAVVRRFARIAFPRLSINYSIPRAWKLYYKELYYKQHISLNCRSIDQTTGRPMTLKSSKLNLLTDEEVPKAVATLVALCEEYQMDLSHLINRLSDPSITVAERRSVLDEKDEVS